MRRLLPATLGLVFITTLPVLAAPATTTISADSKIRAVTVYPDRAQISPRPRVRDPEQRIGPVCVPASAAFQNSHPSRPCRGRRRAYLQGRPRSTPRNFR